MDEKVRHSYLEAMGIQLWYPRVELRSAKPSPLRRLPSPAGEVEDRVPMQQADVKAVKAKADIASVLSGRKAVVVSNGDKKPSREVHEGVTPFKLCLFHSKAACCVIFEVPLQDKELDPRHLRLVEDINRALGSDKHKKTVVFQQWPMIKNRNVPQSDADARVVIQRRLNQLIGDSATKVVIMGDVAARYLPVEAGSLKYSEVLSAAERSKSVATVTLGIDELLQDPIQKRGVWIKIESLMQLDESNA